MRRWTKEEELIILEYPTIKEASEKLNRSIYSCRNKKQCLKRENYTYNISHLEEKYFIDSEFLKRLDNVDTVLDVFAGLDSHWNKFPGITVISNDLNKKCNTDFHEDYIDFLEKMIKFEVKSDIVDLDPFCSPWDVFEDSLRIAKKGIIMTFGDHRYFSMNDDQNKLIMRYEICGKYDIKKIIDSFIRKASKLGVNLKLYTYQEWKMTWRVWFMIQ